MEEMENPAEGVREMVHHEATHTRDKLTTNVALTAAILAVLAAITSLLSGHHANEAMMSQISASDHWAFFQAKSIKANVLASKIDLLRSLGKTVPPDDEQKLLQYKNEQNGIEALAREKEQISEKHLNTHLLFSKGATLFQIAIAVAAIASLNRRRGFWYLGLVFSAFGIILLSFGILHENWESVRLAFGARPPAKVSYSSGGEHGGNRL